jgi:hypothetical protein
MFHGSTGTGEQFLRISGWREQADATGLVAPPLTQLPLDPLALLAEPVIKSTIGAHLATVGLDPRDFGVLGNPRSTAFRWQQPRRVRGRP